MNELMTIEAAKAIALAFDNSGGVIRSDNLHALVESYVEAASRLPADAVEAELRSMETRAVAAEKARDDALAWERKAKDAEAERDVAQEAAARRALDRDEAQADANRLRAALKLKMSEYWPHDPGFCAACDAARAALGDRTKP